jgi:hypothetical protein
MEKSVALKTNVGTAILMMALIPLLMNISCQKEEPDEGNFT